VSRARIDPVSIRRAQRRCRTLAVGVVYSHRVRRLSGVGWVLLLAVVAGCDDGRTAPRGSPATVPGRQEEAAEPDIAEPEAPPWTPCSADSECVVVSVECASPEAAHVSDAPALQARLEDEHEGEHCRLAGDPPRRFAYCDGRCQLDEVRAPELRSCTPGRDDECILLDSPCGPRAFRAERRRDAERLLASPEVARRCQNMAEVLGDLNVLGGPPRSNTARCVRGYCRAVDVEE